MNDDKWYRLACGESYGSKRSPFDLLLDLVLRPHVQVHAPAFLGRAFQTRRMTCSSSIQPGASLLDPNFFIEIS